MRADLAPPWVAAAATAASYLLLLAVVLLALFVAPYVLFGVL